MSKIAVGYFPEKICYLYTDEIDEPVGSYWDIDYGKNSQTQKVKAFRAMLADSEDNLSINKLTSWLQRSWGKQPNKIAIKDIADNKPIKNIKIISAITYGNAGSSYRVLIDKYSVELRDDVLMDSILQVGIAPGGILQGEYVWAKMGQQLKLVRVGSELYKLLMDFSSKKKLKRIGKKALEVGGVYQSLRKERAIFLGYTNTIRFSSPNRNYNSKSKLLFNQNTLKKQMLFYSIDDASEFQTEADNILNNHSVRFINNKKSHTFIEKIGQVELPNDIIANIRQISLKMVKEDILKYSKNEISDWALSCLIEGASDTCNMYPYGSTPIEPLDVSKYLILS